MYEMEGPRSVVQPSMPIARLAGRPAAVRCRPLTSVGHPPGTPVARCS